MTTFCNKKMTSLAVSLSLVASSVISANALDNQEEGSKKDAEVSNYIGARTITGKASSGAGFYTVTTNDLNIRKGPGTSYSSVGKVNTGEILTVHDISNGWAKVTYGGSSSVYCSASYLKKVERVGKILDSIYLRASYSWSADKILLLKKDYNVEIVAIGQVWAKVKYAGKTGYIDKTYLKEISAPSTTSSGSTSTAGIVQITEATYLRAKEDWNSNKLVLLEKGVKAELLSKGTQWSKLKYDGKTGYVSNDYVKLVSSTTGSSSSSAGNTSDSVSTNATIVDATYLRSKASWSADKLVLLPKGVKVSAVSEDKDWVKVTYDGKTGYVCKDYIKISSALPSEGSGSSSNVENTTKYTVNTDSLNVRASASASSTCLGSVKRGQTVEVYSISNGWAKIKYNNGIAYVNASYIVKQGSANNTVNSSVLIYLDAGHGGKDPGAIGTTYSTKEKDAALDVSNRVMKKLQEKGYKVKYSRNTDVYIPLLERTQVANNLGADLFVSIHFNSATTASAAGIETLYKVDGRKSNVLADKIQNSMISAISLKNRGVKTRTDLSVLNNSKMDAVLIEGGFLSNSNDENQIKSASFRETLANAIVKGIEDYLKVVK